VRTEIQSVKHNDLMLKNKVNELAQQNQALMEEKNNYFGNIDSLKHQNMDYVKNLESCMNDIKKLKTNTLRKDGIIHDLNGKLESAYYSNEELTVRIEELDAQVDELSNQLENMEEITNQNNRTNSDAKW